MPPIICRCTQLIEPRIFIIKFKINIYIKKKIEYYSLPGTPFSEFALSLSECVLESELEVEDDESSSSGSSLVSELSSNILEYKLE